MKSPRTWPALALLGALALVDDGAAQGLPPAEARRDARTLSLAEARRGALARNFGVLAAELDRRLGQISARQARRPYVPIASLSADWQDDASLIAPGRDRSLVYSAGVDWVTAYGPRVNVEIGATDYFSGASFVPVPATGLRFGAVVPLLQDAWGRGNLLDQRDLDVALRRALYWAELNELIAEIDVAYWELAYAEADRAIKERSVERARAQFEETRQNIERGLLAAGEIYLVEENLVFFEQQLARSEEALAVARLDVARLALADPSISWAADEEAAAIVRTAPEAERVVEAALAENPRLIARRVALKQAEMQIDFDENQIMPRLDARAGARLAGLEPERTEAWRQALGAENPSWSIGLAFSVPILRDADYARVERAEIERDRARVELERAEAELRYEIHQIVAQLERRLEVLELAERGVRLAELKLEHEREKYQSGLSTLANVVLFQRDWDRARIAERRARTDLKIARTRLERARGTLAADAGVRVR